MPKTPVKKSDIHCKQMGTMKRNTAAFLLLVAIALIMYFLSGCKTKNKTVARIEEKVNIDYARRRFTLTIIDTTGHINADSAHVATPFEMLKSGKPVIAETNGAKVILQYDTLTGNVTATGISKARDVPIKGFQYKFDGTNFHLDGKKKTFNKGVKTHTDVGRSYWAWILFAATVIAIIYVIRKWFWPFK